MLNDQSLSRQQGMNPIVATLLINGLGPLVVYSQLSPHMPQVRALMCSALVPLGENIVSLARHRRLDAFGIFVLAGLVLTGALVFLGGSPRLVLIRESLLGGAFGLAILASLLFPRPLLFYLVAHFVAGNDTVKREGFEGKWALPTFRAFMNRLTIIIAVGTLLEAIIRTYLVFHLSMLGFLKLSPLVHYGIVAVIVMSVIGYERREFEKTGHHPFSVS